MTQRDATAVSELTVAVVFAGGEGVRMGGRKPLRAFGGVPLVEHAVSLARRWTPHVVVAVRSAEQVAGETDAPIILDDPAAEGPIAGLAAALAHAVDVGAPFVLTLPCDAPNLPADLLPRLRVAIGDGLAAMARSGGQLQPTCALWRSAAAARLPGYRATGRRSLHGFGEACGMAVVDWDVADGDPFANANTPEELAALQPRER